MQGTRLSLVPGADLGCMIGQEGGHAADTGGVIAGAQPAGVCRNAESRHDHAILHRSAGRHSDVQVRAFDTAAGSPVMRLSEVWVDGV